MECPNCQTKNRAGAHFCAACGSPLPDVEPIAVSEEEGVHQVPAVSEIAAPTAQEQPADAEPEPATPSPGESDEAGAPTRESEPPAEADRTAPEVTDESPETAGVVDDDELRPLPAGMLLADRYEIVELVSSDEAGNVYRALDLARCAVCGFEGNAPGDEYCGECGAALSSPPACEIREQPQVEEPRAAARFNADGRAYLVLVPEQAEEPDETGPAQPHTRFRWAAKTDTGLVREHNEDCVDAHVYVAEDGPALGLFVVADGVGGQAAGEVASRLATQVIWDQIRETVWLPEMRGERVLPETMETRVEEAVQAANQAVYQQRTAAGNNMGTTVTLALVRDTTAVIANVGDSRTYLWNADGLQPLTVDHSLVQSLIEAGHLEPDEIYTHPHRHIIHRSVGDRPRVEVDTFVHELKVGDRLILCSDGLWEMARDEGIEEILLLEPDPQAACDALVDLANLAGGADNISVIVVEIQGNQAEV